MLLSLKVIVKLKSLFVSPALPVTVFVTFSPPAFGSGSGFGSSFGLSGVGSSGVGSSGVGSSGSGVSLVFTKDTLTVFPPIMVPVPPFTVTE